MRTSRSSPSRDALFHGYAALRWSTLQCCAALLLPEPRDALAGTLTSRPDNGREREEADGWRWPTAPSLETPPALQR